MKCNYKTKMIIPNDPWTRLVYGEYKNYFKCNQLPNFDIEHVDVYPLENGGIAEAVFPKTINDSYKLKLSKGFYKHQVNHCEEILYHEFTHFKDFATMLPCVELVQRESLLTNYSEFHATYVQGLYSCGYIKTGVFTYDKDKALLDRARYKREFDNSFSKTDIRDFKHIEKEIMYLCGEICAYKTHTSDFLETELGFDILPELIRNNVSEIYDILIQINTDESKCYYLKELIKILLLKWSQPNNPLLSELESAMRSI